MGQLSKSSNIYILGDYDPVTGQQEIINHDGKKSIKYKIRPSIDLLDDKSYRDCTFNTINDIKLLKDIGILRPKFRFDMLYDSEIIHADVDTNKIIPPKNYISKETENVPEYIRHLGYCLWPIPVCDKTIIKEENDNINKLDKVRYVNGIMLKQDYINESLEYTQKMFDKEEKAKNQQRNILNRLGSLFKKNNINDEVYLPKSYMMFGRDKKLSSYSETIEFVNSELIK